jgi:hypothetical protein
MDDPIVASPPPESLAARALRYVEIVTEIVRLAKLPEHTAAAWNELAPLVAIDEFLLVGRGKQELDWPAAISCMDRWAVAAEFSSTLRRLEEVDRLVFMELEERITAQGQTSSRQTMTVYEFDAAGRLRRLDTFQ